MNQIPIPLSPDFNEQVIASDVGRSDHLRKLWDAYRRAAERDDVTACRQSYAAMVKYRKKPERVS